jgi:hypothetical protein
MKLLFSQWLKTWFRKLPIINFSVFRTFVGIYLFIFFLWSAPRVELLFSSKGIYSPFLISNIAPDKVIAYALYTLTLVVCILYSVGYKFKIISWLMLVLFFYYFLLNFGVKACTYERVIFIFLFILACGSVDIDAQNKHVQSWVVILLKLYVAFFYFSTGTYKLLIPAWHSGMVLKGAMTSLFGSEAGYWLLDLNLPELFFDLSAWGIIAFELICGFAFYSKRYQKIFFSIGFIFHISVWIFMQLPQFMILPCAYVLFIDPSELSKIITILRNKMRVNKSTS